METPRTPESLSEPLYAIPKVPEGLTTITEDLAREILRKHPENIYAFAARHFEKLLELREERERSQKSSKTDKKYKIPLKPQFHIHHKKRHEHHKTMEQSGWSLHETAKVLDRHKRKEESWKKTGNSDSGGSTTESSKSKIGKASKSSKKSQTFYSDTIKDFISEFRQNKEERKFSESEDTEYSKRTSVRKSSESTKKTEIDEERRKSEEFYESSSRRSSRASSSERRIHTVITKTSLEELQSPQYIEKVYRATNETTLVMQKNLETLQNSKLTKSFEERKETKTENYSSRSEKSRKSPKTEKKDDAFKSKLKETQCLMEKIDLGFKRSVSAKDLYRNRRSSEFSGGENSEISLPSVRPSSTSAIKNLTRNNVALENFVLPEISPKSSRNSKTPEEFILPLLSGNRKTEEKETETSQANFNLSDKLKEIEIVEKTIENLLSKEKTEDTEMKKRPPSYGTPLTIGLEDVKSYVLSEGSPSEIPDSVVTVIIHKDDDEVNNKKAIDLELGEEISSQASSPTSNSLLKEEKIDSAFGEFVPVDYLVDENMEIEHETVFPHQDLEGIKEEEGDEEELKKSEDEKVLEIVTSSLEEVLKEKSENAGRKGSDEIRETEESDDSIRYIDASSKSEDNGNLELSSSAEKTGESSPDLATPVVPELNLQDLDSTECSDKTLSCDKKEEEEGENSTNEKSLDTFGVTESEARDSELDEILEDSKINELICRELIGDDFKEKIDNEKQTEIFEVEKSENMGENVLVEEETYEKIEEEKHHSEKIETMDEKSSQTNSNQETARIEKIDDKSTHEQISTDLNISDESAATLIQAGVRGYLTRKNLEKTEKTKDKNIVTREDTTFIAISPRISPPSLEKLTEAALTIQKYYKKFKKKKGSKKTSDYRKTSMKMNEFTHAAMIIQRNFRKHKNKKEIAKQEISIPLQEIGKSVQAAITIQKSYKKYLNKKSLQQEKTGEIHKNTRNSSLSSQDIEKLIKAAMIIQKSYRKYMNKKLRKPEKIAKVNEGPRKSSAFQDIEKFINAAITIQKSYRNYVKRKLVKQVPDQSPKKVVELKKSSPRLEKLTQASMVIQKNYRKYKKRKMEKKIAKKSEEKTTSEPAKLEKLTKASLIIQKSYRRYENRKSRNKSGNLEKIEVLENEKSTKKNSMTNNSPRTSSPRLEKLIQASLVIQKSYRKYKNRKVKCEAVPKNEKISAKQTKNFLQHTGEFHDSVVLPIANLDTKLLSTFKKPRESSAKTEMKYSPRKSEFQVTETPKTPKTEVFISPSTANTFYTENMPKRLSTKNEPQITTFFKVVLCDEDQLKNPYINFMANTERRKSTRNSTNEENSLESSKEPLAVPADSPRGVIIEEIKSLE